MPRIIGWSCALVGCLVGLRSGSADACTPLSSMAYERDAAYADDLVPPTIIDVTTEVVRNDPHDGGGCPSDVVLTLQTTDDRVSAEQIGYEAVIDGVTPDGVSVPAGPRIYPYGGPGLVLITIPHDQDLAFDAVVTAIDRNGNRSEPRVVSVHDDVGCSAGDSGSARAGAVLIALAALVVSARGPSARRRRTPPPRR